MTMTSPRRYSRRRRGVTLYYGIVLMAVVTMFISLSVDFGRAQLAKTELARAADAAARYAAMGLSDNTYIAKAIDAANDNTVDGTALVLQSTDITAGTWASGTFTAGTASPNAVRVIAQRAASRGTA